MKKTSNLILALLFAFSFVMFSCGEEEEEPKTATELFTEAAVGTWTLSSVVVPENTATTADQWSGFTITFAAEGTVTATGQPTGATTVWPASSGFTINATSSTTGSVVVADAAFGSADITFNAEGTAATTATIEITVPAGTEVASARAASVAGTYTLSMSK